MPPTRTARLEFGDFQTPLGLAREICALIAHRGFSPASIVEPTCGRGAWLVAALEAFPRASHVVGLEREAAYVREATHATHGIAQGRQVRIWHADFFATDWSRVVATLPGPLLIIGNPPWVTNATLGSLGSANLPTKTNETHLRGLDALTGKANFDISESMLRKNIQWLADTPGMLAVLCKTTVARKVLAYTWSQGVPVESAELHRIDAHKYFGASVDACLLAVRIRPGSRSAECRDFKALGDREPRGVFGFRDGTLVADVGLYDRWDELAGRGLSGWRSGIKHDCSRVFELVQEGTAYANQCGARVDVEPEVVYPLLKSSDLARNRCPRKWLLVPQKAMRASPQELQCSAPKAWQYLLANEALLAKRRSSIYRQRPCFSIFGVGDYSFSPWKVAISGLYKKLEFAVIPPFRGQPVVLDDTCYFFACHSEEECHALHRLVQSQPAQEFWSSMVFWDAKRPITAHLLNSLNLTALAHIANMKSELTRDLAQRQAPRGRNHPLQHQLSFMESPEGVEDVRRSV